MRRPPRSRRLRALVTGAAGFIGSHLAEALCCDGYDVVGIDALLERPYPAATKRAVLAELATLPSFRFRALDLRARDHDLGELLAGVEVVVHAAALAGLTATTADPGSAWTHNALATARLAHAATVAGVGRFVHVSTSSVYGGEVTGDERQPQRPISVYGHTKRAGEQAVLRAAASGLDAVVVRYFSVYGPRQRADMAYCRFIEALLDGDPVTVHGDGSQRRSVTDVNDAVRGTLAALRHGRSGEAYNIGGDQSVSVIEALDTIAGAVGRRPQMRFVPVPVGDQRATSADTTKARRELGWTPEVPPAVGIARQVAWQRERRRRRSGVTEAPPSPATPPRVDQGLRSGGRLGAPRTLGA